MCRIETALSALTFCLALTGCGDGSIEVKSKSGSGPTVVEEKKTVIKEQPVIVEKPTETKKVIIEKK